MTHQRKVILEAVKSAHNHLTADEIYDRVRALTFPGMLPPYTIINGQIIELHWKQYAKKD